MGGSKCRIPPPWWVAGAGVSNGIAGQQPRGSQRGGWQGFEQGVDEERGWPAGPSTAALERRDDAPASAPGAPGQAWGGRGCRAAAGHCFLLLSRAWALAAVSLDGTHFSTHFTRNKKDQKNPKPNPQKTKPTEQ